VFDAFISYSHAADGTLAAALQQGLHRFAKPLFKLRAIRVFRDETTLAMTPRLWPDIEKALRDSRFFILMADPLSAKSEWVQQEVACWLGMERAENMLIVWTGGEVVWNKARKDFDWDRTNSLPPMLAGVFKGNERFTMICAGPERKCISPASTLGSQPPWQSSRPRYVSEA
jgi:TIR domain